jgi:sugar O-acyltransferase (sialic acid O-acetyltransferase NeuD family)
VGQRIVIVGTGGMGREAAAWVIDAFPEADIVGFLDDTPARWGATVAERPVLGGLDWLEQRPDVEVVPAVGAPRLRATLVGRLDALGARLVTLVHPSAHVGPRTSVAPGAIVCPNVFLSCDVRIGRGAIVNYGSMIGHDGHVGACSFLAPGVHIAGNVTIGAAANVGIGASVIQGLTVGEGAVVGAGAVVVRAVAPDTTVVGVPARPIRGAGS